MDQPGKVANPARGELNKGKTKSLSAFAPENLVSRDGFGSPVPRQPAHLYNQDESGAYLRDSSRVSRRRPYIYVKPPNAIGSVPSLWGHAIAYRWSSLPRVRRHRRRTVPLYRAFQNPLIINIHNNTDSITVVAGRPGSSEVPRNPLTRWDVSSIPANGIFLTKELKNKTKNAQRVEND